MQYFVIYDIADPNRLRRVARAVEDYGVRMQKSKFEAEITLTGLRSLQNAVAMVIELEEDGVKYFPLCQACFGKREVFGKSNPHGYDNDYEII